MSEEFEVYRSKVDDEASVELMAKAKEDEVTTVFDRYETQKNQCKFGREGVCCKICYMGPCRKLVDGLVLETKFCGFDPRRAYACQFVID